MSAMSTTIPSPNRDTLEYRKLRQETGWRGLAVPLASVIFGAASIIVAGITYYSDQRKAIQDHAIACANLSITMGSLISSISSTLEKIADPTKKAQFLERIILALPPNLAVGVTQAFRGQVGTDQLNDVSLAQIKSHLTIDCETVGDFAPNIFATSH
jgi:hypothetical protein